ncbi:MAG TPA: glycogen-binding domain-containing protein [Gemmatimonadales bacterium]|nr:glycogen-binding domain-containing protein [Gemmatimonadales bacterium]
MSFPLNWPESGYLSLVLRGAITLVVAVSLAAVPSLAQTRASLGVGVSTVRTEGGTTFSSGSLSPELRYATPTVLAQASGFLASLPGGDWAGYGRLYLWGTTPPVTDRVRLGLEGILTGTTQSMTGDTARAPVGAWTAAVHGLAEVLWFEPAWGFGVGAGPSSGWIANDATPGFVALRTRARAWWRPGGHAGATDWQVAVEPTRFLGDWFTDLSAGVTLERGAAVVSLSTEARVSGAYGSSGAGSAVVQLFVRPGVSLELGGGSYLREPYQGFPRGRFLSFGVRIGPTHASHTATAPRLTPLVPQSRGDSVVVQFRFQGVHAVAIAGDWNAWRTVPLRPLGDDRWEGTLALARGLYHFNLLVDEQEWVVPHGVATVPDGLGGMVAVLLVP